MKLEEKLLRLRKQHGLSQQEMADELAVSRQTISKWESGVTVPSMENLLRIGKLFDTSIDFLVEDGTQPESALAVTEDAAMPEGKAEYIVIPGKWNVKRIVTALCVMAFLSGILVGGCFLYFKGEADPAVPMQELEGEDVDISQADSFSIEPLEP